MTHMQSLIASFVLALLVTACAGVPVTEVRNSLASAKPCCNSYDQLQFKPLQPGERTKIELSTSSPVFILSVGSAYVEALSLPPSVSFLAVQALHTGYLPKATYPDPIFIFLDAAKQPIAEEMDLPIQWNRHQVFPGLYEYFYGTRIAVPAAARYVVVAAHPNSSRVQVAIAELGNRWPVHPAPVGTVALIPQ
ncbi:hypothetical protein O4G98_13345 [Zoogloeaceae bacterium G21618-S1]|nr:hypothetical protein [Zoogloeaceae bacterium G21618-S1]